VGANPIRQPLQPEAIAAVMEVTKWLKPKGAATDMFSLTPPRHISTLPKSDVLTVSRLLPVYPDQRTFSEPVGMSQRCH
jgi:hypothetical protein